MTADRVTHRFLEDAERDVVLADLPRASPVLTARFTEAGQPILNRPLFVPRSRLSRFIDDATSLFDLLLALPRRQFGGDLDQLGAALGIAPRARALMTRMQDTPPFYGRADMYDDGENFRLLEFNLGSELGGIERAGEIPKHFLHLPGFAAFAGREQLGWVDTGAVVAAALRAAARTIGADNPVVALIDAPGSLVAYGQHWNSLRQVMQDQGLTFLIGELSQLDYTLRPSLQGQPIDVVLRCVSVAELLEIENGEALIEPLIRAHEAGQLVLWTTMSSTMFANKGALALLWDTARRGALDATEQALLTRLTPECFSLLPGGDGLWKHCIEAQYDLVLKPADAYGGQGVVPGWSVTPEAWFSALLAAWERPFIVQRRVRPKPEPVMTPHGRQPSEAAWGAFFTPAGFAGAYARVLPAGAPVIGVSADRRTRTAGVFTYPDIH